jgi:hypothetical protein
MHTWRRCLTALSLAIALIIAGQGRASHAHAQGLGVVSAGEKADCQDHKGGVPPAERGHGADCGPCQFCGGLHVLASPPLLIPADPIEARAVFVRSPWRYPYRPAQAQRARAPPLLG